MKLNNKYIVLMYTTIFIVFTLAMDSAKRKAEDELESTVKRARKEALRVGDFALYYSEMIGNAIIHIIGNLCDGKYQALTLAPDGDFYVMKTCIFAETNAFLKRFNYFVECPETLDLEDRKKKRWRDSVGIAKVMFNNPIPFHHINCDMFLQDKKEISEPEEIWNKKKKSVRQNGIKKMRQEKKNLNKKIEKGNKNWRKNSGIRTRMANDAKKQNEKEKTELQKQVKQNYPMSQNAYDDIEEKMYDFLAEQIAKMKGKTH